MIEVKNGQMWRLGRHSLWCGDAMSNNAPCAHAELVLTDPPFELSARKVKASIETQSDKFIVAGCGIEYHKLIASCNFKFHYEVVCKRSKPQSLPGMNGPQILHWSNAFLSKNGIHCFDRDLADGYFPSIIEVGNTEIKVAHAKPLKWAIDLLTACHAQTICDPFVGSGTTLIACEMLGKSCFAFEIDPKKCELTIARWHHKTNLTPILING